MACSTTGFTHAEDGEGRRATFTFDDTVLPASLKDLPTIVESYKTYDDITLVKTGDIGQVERHPVLAMSLLLSFTSSSHAQECCLRLRISSTLLRVSCATDRVTVCSVICCRAQKSALHRLSCAVDQPSHGPKQVILVGGKQSASVKARHGLTPPMRDAARRMFDRTPAVDQKTMQKLEDDLLLIAQVQRLAPLD